MNRRGLLLAFLALPLLACSGLLGPLSGYGRELAHTEVYEERPFSLDVVGTGEPLDVWLRYELQTHGDDFHIAGHVGTRVDGRTEKNPFRIDARGVHHGPWRETPDPATPPGGKGVRLGTLRIATLPAVPPGESIEVRGRIQTDRWTLLEEGRAIVTE